MKEKQQADKAVFESIYGLFTTKYATRICTSSDPIKYNEALIKSA